MRKWMHILCVVAAAMAVAGIDAAAQVDTTGMYRERMDSLDAVVVTSHGPGNYLSKGNSMRVEVVTADGLKKMACCNVAESFENSASVTVGYSDAVTGARQIRLLGLSGIYTQMLDESRPVMRGITSPFALTYTPGQWLESIQIAKGAASVTGGVESVTGQINMEHRKPTDEKPFFLSLTGMSDSRISGDVASSLQLGDRLSTVILGHADCNFRHFDMNGDGFMDDPMVKQFNLANRWLYYAPGIQVRAGFNAVSDYRQGGQQGYDRDSYGPGSPWGSDIGNQLFNTYIKIGIPMSEDQGKSIALVADYTSALMDAAFGSATYLAEQRSFFANLIWRNSINDRHDFTLGARGAADIIGQNLLRSVQEGVNSFQESSVLPDIGLYGEYTFHYGDALTAIAGASLNWYGDADVRVSPRATVKYQPVKALVLRLNGGRGVRPAMPLTDNIGIFSTGKLWTGSYQGHILEDGWTYGGNATVYLPIGADPENAYLSFDFFRTQFAQQLIVDYEHTANVIEFYTSDGAPSFTNTFQADFAVEPIERLTLNLTARYTDAKVSLAGQGLVERPMTPRFKGVVNLQYRTNLSKWIFDFTAALNGNARAYSFMDMERTPVYPLLYAQVTRRFKGIDVYIGGENLTGFRQKTVILGVPETAGFDASAVWGPLMGLRVNAGLRVTVWKTY